MPYSLQRRPCLYGLLKIGYSQHVIDSEWNFVSYGGISRHQDDRLTDCSIDDSGAFLGLFVYFRMLMEC